MDIQSLSCLTRRPFLWNSTHGTWTQSRMGLLPLHTLPVSLPWFFMSTYDQASSLCLLALMSTVCSAYLCLGYSGVKFQKRLITILNKHPYFIKGIFLLLTLCGCRQKMRVRSFWMCCVSWGRWTDVWVIERLSVAKHFANLYISMPQRGN